MNGCLNLGGAERRLNDRNWVFPAYSRSGADLCVSTTSFRLAKLTLGILRSAIGCAWQVNAIENNER